MINEIGSEYHEMPCGNSTGAVFPQDSYFVFSGRTAIDAVLKECCIRRVMMPAYCCDSMIEPFRSRGVRVGFFDVYDEDGLKIGLEIPDDADAVLWCNYFGFRTEMPDMTAFLERGGIIIEDMTHSLFSDRAYHSESHYVVASLRKWGAVLCGGLCAARNGRTLHVSYDAPPEAFISQKAAAMHLKSEYLLDGDESRKEQYLKQFSESNKWLAEHYQDLRIDDRSRHWFSVLDAEQLRQQRIRNAGVLYEGLKDHPYIRPLFAAEDMDCPLFVPVAVDSSRRADLRRYLAEHQVYCPVHWPHPDAECASELYETELSLICDQRYQEADMRRILDVINSWDR